MQQDIKKFDFSQVKKGDIYRFYPKKTEIESRSGTYMWCIDPQWVCLNDGELINIYWLYFNQDSKEFEYRPDSKILSPATVDRYEGKIEKHFNLNDVNLTNQNNYKFYKEKDKFEILKQKGCSIFYFIKKEAKRSKSITLKLIEEKIEESLYEMQSLQRKIEYLKEKKKEVESDNISKYFLFL